MTKEETISNLKAYLNGDTAIGNIIPLRSVLESALEYLELFLPSNLDEAAEEIIKDWNAYGDGEYKKLVIAGAEWVAEQGETVEGYIAGTNEVAAILAIPRKEHNKGDDVVVQIRKK